MKGLVLAGGTGSRLYPLTKVINKHLLPVGRYPMIYYPIGALVAAGIRDVMIVTGGNNAGMFLELLGNGSVFGLGHLHYAYQERAGGIADALKAAEDFVDGDRCVVVLGDNIIGGSIKDSVDGFREQERGARILLKEVSNPAEYGVAQLGADFRVIRIIEKPKQHVSNYAVIGVYMYDEALWHILPGLRHSARGELEITDVNNAYLERGVLTADVLECDWGDAGGSHESLLEAGVIANRCRPLESFDLGGLEEAPA